MPVITGTFPNLPGSVDDVRTTIQLLRDELNNIPGIETLYTNTVNGGSLSWRPIGSPYWYNWTQDRQLFDGQCYVYLNLINANGEYFNILTVLRSRDNNPLAKNYKIIALDGFICVLWGVTYNLGVFVKMQNGVFYPMGHSNSVDCRAEFAYSLSVDGLNINTHSYNSNYFNHRKVNNNIICNPVRLVKTTIGLIDPVFYPLMVFGVAAFFTNWKIYKDNYGKEFMYRDNRIFF